MIIGVIHYLHVSLAPEQWLLLQQSWHLRGNPQQWRPPLQSPGKHLSPTSLKPSTSSIQIIAETRKSRKITENPFIIWFFVVNCFENTSVARLYKDYNVITQLGTNFPDLLRIYSPLTMTKEAHHAKWI